MTQKNIITVQGLIHSLNNYWYKQGCLLDPTLDLPVGAGTFHPSTFLRSIGPEPWNVAFVQPSRRPTDGRYGENPNRLQKFHQYQVILKPSPVNIQQIYLESLQYIGVDLLSNDIRFVEDNWESPSLGAWGLGWEVWQNGMEISQYTYFQQMGGIPCKPVSGELTYGIERLAMSLQQVNNVYDLIWHQDDKNTITYGELSLLNEQQMSKYNFDLADTAILLRHFSDFEQQALTFLSQNLFMPAFEMLCYASHTFNTLDARKAISVTERQSYILKLRNISLDIAQKYYEHRESLGFPLLKSDIKGGK